MSNVDTPFDYDFDEERSGFAAPVAPQGRSRRVGALELAMLAVTVLGLASLVLQTAGGPWAGTWLGFLSSFGLLSVGGAGTFIARYKDREPGIQNDGIQDGGATGRGLVGWLLGVGFTAIYVVIYWFPELLGEREGADPVGLVRVVDAPARALSGWPASRWFLYGVLYTLAVTVFGVRTWMRYRHVRYHRIRTVSVFVAQFFAAWLIPNLLIKLKQPYMEFNGVWPLKQDYLWPDKVNEFLSAGAAGKAMLAFAIGAVVIGTGFLTYRYGKRWYCSWVCGCGGLAETLGDPWRQLSSKKPGAWKLERVLIHAVLALVLIATLALWANAKLGWFGSWAYELKAWYGFYIGAVFSGVIGVGFYPLLGSRVWCRFGCPQAAILGLIQRVFSRFRITTNGGQCMSCGNCSTYCEMGIDVRAYAERSENIVRASCVGCGVCAAVCPRGVLKLENGMPGDRYDGADSPLAAFRAGLFDVDIHGYEPWPPTGCGSGDDAQR